LNGVVSACQKVNGFVVTLQFTSCEAKTLLMFGWTMTDSPASSISPQSFDIPSGTSTTTFTVDDPGPVAQVLTVQFGEDASVPATLVQVAVPPVSPCP
jgi:hypothetical protein